MRISPALAAKVGSSAHQYVLSRHRKVWVQFNLGYKWSEVCAWLHEQVVGCPDLDGVARSITEGLSTDDERVLAILQYVHDRTTYTGDKVKWRMPDYWQPADLTHSLRTGDCEDGAALIYVLARKAGVPMERLYFVAGDVLGGGHAWVWYFPVEYPLNPVALDWCYWFEKGAMGSRPFYELQGTAIRRSDEQGSRPDAFYYRMWWLCNDKEGIGKWL